MKRLLHPRHWVPELTNGIAVGLGWMIGAYDFSKWWLIVPLLITGLALVFRGRFGSPNEPA